MPADPIHHSPTTNKSWLAAAAESHIKTPVTPAAAHLWAWHDPTRDLTTKAAHRFPHHEVDGYGNVGASNNRGCLAAIAALNGGTNLPAGDRQAVYAHLKAHLVDAKVPAPELKSLRSVAADVIRSNRARESASRAAAAALLVARNREAERRRHRGVIVPTARPRRVASTAEVREYRRSQHGVREARLAADTWEIRAASGSASDLLFTGYASLTCRDFDDNTNAYAMEDKHGLYTESIIVGAFEKTIRERCDTAFLLNHGGPTLARTKAGTLKLSEHRTGTPTGLYVEAQLDRSRPDVKILMSAIERGELDEMSFAFRVVRQKWNDDYDRRWIQEVNLNQGDVSVVNYGSNPHTGGHVSIAKQPKAPQKTPDPYMDPFDPGKTGAGGYTEAESAKILAATAAALIAVNRSRERARV